MVSLNEIKQLINRSHLASSDHSPIVFKSIIRHWNDYRTMITSIPAGFKNPPYNLNFNDEVIIIIIPTGITTDKYTTQRPSHGKNQEKEETQQSRTDSENKANNQKGTIESKT